MGHPHGALFVTGGLIEPTIATVTMSEFQTGAQDKFGGCLDPHVERVSYTISNCSAGYTLTISIRVATGADPTGSYTDLETGKACASGGSSDFNETTPINDGGSEDRRWQGRVRVIRTSDSGIVDEVESSVHQITTMVTCLE